MNNEYFVALEGILATERIDAYRQDGADEITTFSRYLLNMALCEALYSPLQFAEIALRNAIHVQLTGHYGGADWYDKMPTGDLPGWQAQQILNARGGLARNGKPIGPGAMVAELHFGFWTGFFNKGHARTGLGSLLAAQVFPAAPRASRALSKLDRRWQQIRRLRNRVFHHERILHWKDLDDQHGALLEVTGWISPELEEATSALDRFTKIRADGLTPWHDKIRSHWPAS